MHARWPSGPTAQRAKHCTHHSCERLRQQWCEPRFACCAQGQAAEGHLECTTQHAVPRTVPSLASLAGSPGAAHRSTRLRHFSRNWNCLLSWINLKAARERNLQRQHVSSGGQPQRLLDLSSEQAAATEDPAGRLVTACALCAAGSSPLLLGEVVEFIKTMLSLRLSCHTEVVFLSSAAGLVTDVEVRTVATPCAAASLQKSCCPRLQARWQTDQACLGLPEAPMCCCSQCGVSFGEEWLPSWTSKLRQAAGLRPRTEYNWALCLSQPQLGGARHRGSA